MSEKDEAISSAASVLGRRAAGVPKKFTPEEIERRRAQMEQINASRAAQVHVARGVVRRVSAGSRRSG